MMSALIQLAADQALQGISASGEGAPPPDFSAIDSLASLIVNAVKYYPMRSDDKNRARLGFFDWTLSIIADHIVSDQREKGATWNQRPFYRLLLEIIQTISDNDPCLDVDVQTDVVIATASSSEALHVLRFQLIKVVTRELHKLRPLSVPSFAFAWLQLISHRSYMPRLLITPQGWPMLKALLVDIFVFLRPFLRNVKLNAAVRQLYNGTLRVLLVLLHDFPEFLCEFHFAFCDVIPETCIQLRNLVLSAFPRLNAQGQPFKLPDPFTPNLKVDQLPDIAHSPRVRSDFRSVLQRQTTPYPKTDGENGKMNLMEALSSYITSRQPPHLLSHLHRFLALSPEQASQRGMDFDAQLLNALVLHVGVEAITALQGQSSPALTTSAPLEIFQQLGVDLKARGRYCMLNAIANQLRYPNNQTYYFSCVLLYLFAEAKSEMMQEMVTRVLLERLIVHRPHPWGLLITFIELIKNPQYNFWKRSFVHCATEIERLFDSVARSCMGGGSTHPEAAIQAALNGGSGR
jgi:CCR4-NOT transcription complex subunit 1